MVVVLVDGKMTGESTVRSTWERSSNVDEYIPLIFTAASNYGTELGFYT